MYFRTLKKYLSAYILPIFKKAKVISIATTLKNIIVFTIVEIWKNNIPNDIDKGNLVVIFIAFYLQFTTILA